MEISETVKVLKRSYFAQLIPAGLLLILVFITKPYVKFPHAAQTTGLTTSIVLAILSGITSIALPVFYRSYFVYRVRHQKQISRDDFLLFERTLSRSALLSSYFLVVSIVLNLPQTANILITLFALYGAYFFYPSEKRIRFDMKIFRINPPGKKEKLQ